jgi:hypothetical protein
VKSRSRQEGEVVGVVVCADPYAVAVLLIRRDMLIEIKYKNIFYG